MKCIQRTLVEFTVIFIVAIIVGCGNTTNGEISEGNHEEEGSEESGTQYTLEDTCDEVYRGVRLIMSYDAQSNSFNGTTENTTEITLKQVRVEVHLSNGVELGPTTPGDLSPGEIRNITLTATNRNFDTWSAHPEVGIGEHGQSERQGEHSRESRSEHEEEYQERDSD